MNKTTEYFIADLHLGHTNMALHRGFNSVEEHDNFIIAQWNSVVGKRDVVYLLGDVTMEKKSNYHLLSKLNGVINVVLGNHDFRNHVPFLLKHVNSVCGCLKFKGYLVTHIPVHPMEFDYRVKGNIHGHLHELNVQLNGEKDERYICVSAEQLNYLPTKLSL